MHGDLIERFNQRFGSDPRIFRAPGRVNLIGEHTDYNDGFVMPAAIDLGTSVAIAPRTDDRLVVHSENVNSTAEAVLRMASLVPRHEWSDYVFGVARELLAANVPLRGANILITSSVPSGAGLSSSAALEVSIGFALMSIAGRPVDYIELARACQRAENEFVGARCGIMDQFTATHGSVGDALLLDCRSLDFRLLRLPRDVRLVICNTMVKHKIAAGEYNARRAECETAVRLLAERVPSVRALRDVQLTDLDEHGSALPPVILRRAHHIVTENQRVLDGAAAIERGDITRFGLLMAASHCSLRDDFEVSCTELDTMVDLAQDRPGFYGARMTGGGFGGCTINLVAAAATTEFVEALQRDYERRMRVRPVVYVCNTAGRVAEV